MVSEHSYPHIVPRIRLSQTMNTEITESLPSSLPVIHVQSETAGFKAGITLTETNYNVWSQILEMQIAGRERLDFILGDTLLPQKTDASYGKWYAENQKVKGWLLTSMSPEIMKRYLRLPTAREIWSALAKAFYDGSDESQIFALHQQAFSLKQVGRPLSTYFGDLVAIFQELDHRDKIIMKDPDDMIAYVKSVERLRVHIFLNGLDTEFEQIRGEVLRKDPVLDLDEAYAYIRRDAVRRTTQNTKPEHLESSVMVAYRPKPQATQPASKSEQLSGPRVPSASQNRRNNTGGAQPDRVCTHCGGTGHTKARCYDLIGYPEWWDPAKASSKRTSKATPHTSLVVAEPIRDLPESASGNHDSEDNWLWY
ncbi:unnamed protein product [Camellia sinensis]